MAFLGCGLGLVGPAARADVHSWLVDKGDWSNPANWAPFGVPAPGDVALIGNTASAHNGWVTLDVGAVVGSLVISDGMVLDTEDSPLLAGSITVTGINEDDGFDPSMLWVSSTPAPVDCQTGGLVLTDGARLMLQENSTIQVNGLLDHTFDGSMPGTGTIILTSDEPVAWIRDGHLAPKHPGLHVIQVGSGRIDLDGSVAHDRTLFLNKFAGNGSGFTSLTIDGDGLTDPFDDDIWVGGNCVLTMNLTEGWEMGPGSTLRMFGNMDFPGPATLNGTAFLMRGTFLVLDHVIVNAPLTLADTAFVEVWYGDRLELNDATVVDGASFDLATQSVVDFDGPTTMLGATFQTAGTTAQDGLVNLHGPSTWSGVVTSTGMIRPLGDAVVTGPTIIEAATFDLDGAGTAWTIGNSLTVQAAAIDTNEPNVFDGHLQLTGGVFGRLTVELQDPASSWTMNGTMDLGGVGGFFVTRIAGSPVVLTGQTAVDGMAQILADTTLAAGGEVLFEDADATLRLGAGSRVEVGTTVTGSGTLLVGPEGRMTLEPDVDLGGTDLTALGELEIGVLSGEPAPGLAVVRDLTFGSASRCVVSIGGLEPGATHDLLMVEGVATLDGSLDVRLAEIAPGQLYEPVPGDAFTILSASLVEGSFDADPVTHVPGLGYHWTTETTPDSVTVQLDAIVPCPADVSGDGLVGGADLGLLLAAWGPCPTCHEDLDGDGDVDGADLGLLLSGWGGCDSDL